MNEPTGHPELRGGGDGGKAVLGSNKEAGQSRLGETCTSSSTEAHTACAETDTKTGQNRHRTIQAGTSDHTSED